MPSANSFGARLRAPISSTRRVMPSAVSGPYRAGSVTKPLSGCSPRISRRHRAAYTVTVSLTTCPGRRSAVTSHRGRIRNRTAAW
jgi:hypothetical protein